MKVDKLLKKTRLSLPQLADISGVPLGYLKQLSAGNQEPGPDTRRKLAIALRDHRRTLEEVADKLDPAL